MKRTTFVLLIFLRSVVNAQATDAGAQEFCKTKWTTGTVLNQRMYEHCVEELTESQSQVTTFAQSHQSETWFKDVVQQGCVERWTKDGFVQAEMVSFCYKQELESYKELKYQSGLASYNSGCAEACFKVWKGKAGAVFGKTEECYRKRSEAPNFALPKSLLLLLGAGPTTETAGQAGKGPTAN